MTIFDSLEDKNHTCGVDNLYISAKFCKNAYQHPMRVILYGVAHRSGRGVPDCVLQDEKQTKVEQVKGRGTVKAAKLTGDPGCPNLIAVSLYNTKPVHFFSAALDSIKWIEQKREVWDNSKRRCVSSSFSA